MRDLYKILQRLDEMKVAHCFQSQGQVEYYNLMVKSPTGKSFYFSSDNIDDIERELKAMWGNLLNSTPIPKPF